MNDLLRLAGREAGRVRSAPFVVLPLGSVEYHGPHGPLGTDVTLAEGFARALAIRRDALVLPAIAYAVAPLPTRDRPGTLAIAPDAYLAYLTEVLRAVVRAGAERVVALNGHSENQFALRLAAEQVANERREASLLMVNWWRLLDAGAGAEVGFGEADGHGHGGPLELSVAAAFDPSGVEPSGAADVPYEAPWWRGAAQVVGRGQAPLGFDGYHGRASEISAEAGSRLVDATVERLVRLVDDWLERARAP